jgi:anti-sigma B factor antagonist
MDQPTVHIRAVTRLWREGVMALSITNSRIDGVIVVHLSGAIFFDEESTSLRVHVKDLLGKSRQIVLDLGNVTRIDSSGLGTLVALYASARKIGGDIKLANLGNHIKEALQITRIVTVFEIFSKTEDAIASFNRATAIG